MAANSRFARSMFLPREEFEFAVRQNLRRPAVMILSLSLLLLAACNRQPSPVPGPGPDILQPTFSRMPPPADYNFLTSMLPAMVTPPNADDPFKIDFRHRDASGMDLTGQGKLLADWASFDTATRWPGALPPDFNPERLLELGKNPGLGVRALHAKGITGKGVHVAYVDQTLLLDHAEYQGRIVQYAEIGKAPEQAEMHASAVVSILAGKTVGVAPDAFVTYYAAYSDDGHPQLANYAAAVNAILDENAQLPPSQRVRVIGMSLGWMPDTPGVAEMDKAIARAKKEGVGVFSVDTDKYYSVRYMGAGRDPEADPDDLKAYGPGAYWADYFYRDPARYNREFWVPMDARTTAGPGSQTEYAFYRIGGMSWVVPWVTGMYALALQVKPDLTPDDFLKLALRTGAYQTVTHEGKTYKAGPFLQPAELIARLR